MHALVRIRRHKCSRSITPGIAAFLQLAPRIVFLGVWLASLGAMLSDLATGRTLSTQEDLGERKWEERTWPGSLHL